MPRIRLTQVAVDKLKPTAKGRVIFWDSLLPGFGIRIGRQGGKTWIAMYRIDGRAVMETLGRFERIRRVDDARELARKAMQRAASDGEHPTEAKRRRTRET